MVLPILLTLQACGCARTRISEFQITNYDEHGQVQRYVTTFDEAYYDIDGQGNLDVALRRSEPSDRDAAVDIVQVLCLRTVWRSIPGRTVAESMQINATVSYSILRGGDGTTFEGAGSVFFKQKRKTDALEGTLDLAALKPTRTLAAGSELFRQAELTGRFLAKRDPRKVVRIINEMDRRFRKVAGRAPARPNLPAP